MAKSHSWKRRAPGGSVAGRSQSRGGKTAHKCPCNLRQEYHGYCPLRAVPGASSSQVAIDESGRHVERRSFKSLTPQVFFDEFVKLRRPVVLDARRVKGGPLRALFGLRGVAARWGAADATGTAALRESTAGRCRVAVERRQSRDAAFGQQNASSRTTMTLADFCKEVEAGCELSYLTTQVLEEDADGCPKSLAAPHVMELLKNAKRWRPKLLGNLAPVQFNIWFGRTREGSSSGLHHDFHDNIYVLLRGQKEFRLFSPRCVDYLQPAGALRGRPQLHPNGLICYVPGLREDGALVNTACTRRRTSIKRTTPSRKKSKKSQGARECNFDSDEDEALLEQALDSALHGDCDTEDDANDDKARDALPDSFCSCSSADGAGTAGRAPCVPHALHGCYSSAVLTAGDLLYLPGSWFHEVFSQGGDEGGHLAFNIWMAPPRLAGTFEQPYEDDFWEAHYIALREKARCTGLARERPLGRRTRKRRLSCIETSPCG